MSISLIAAGVATLAAVAFTGILVLRCTRTPRLDLAAWAVAVTGLTLALAAQAYGFSQGFSPTTFRIIQVGAQLVAPVGLIWGWAELAGKSAGARFTARLALIALTVVGGVILATDVLGSTSFSTAWPAASTYYQVIPIYLLDLIGAVTVLWGLAVVLMVGVRARRDAGWRRVFPAILAAVFAAVLVLGVRAPLPVNAGYPALGLAAVLLIWFAAGRAGRVPLMALREGMDGEDRAWADRRRGYGSYPDDTGYGGLYRPDTGAFPEVGADTGYGFYRADTGGMAVDTGGFGPDTGYSLYRADTGAFGVIGPEDSGVFDRLYRDGEDPAPAGEPGRGRHGAPYDANGNAAGLVETGDILPVADAIPPGAMIPGLIPADMVPGMDTNELYGQIAIYTLLDGRTEEFDRLAKDVVDQVKQHEPNTLVYVMHGVPSAPMQRILYEVYRDAAAFDDHARQPYVEHFEEQRRPFVLATNVIELGVRQAKVVPLEGKPQVRESRPRDIWGQELR